MIVMKCGGTSSQDAAATRNVVFIIQTHLQGRLVAVIFAITRATSELEQTEHLALTEKVDDAVALTTRVVERLHGEFFAKRS